MRNLTTFLLIRVIFVSAVSAQNSVVPIVYSETLIVGGAWQKNTAERAKYLSGYF